MTTWNQAKEQIRKDKQEAERRKEKRDLLIWSTLQSFADEFIVAEKQEEVKE